MRRAVWYGTAAAAAVAVAAAALSMPADIVPDDAKIAGETSVVRVFFGNNALDSNVRCNRSFPVLRTIEKTKAPGSAAIGALLAGPTEEERAAGYFTSLNSGVALQSLRIASGTAYADFDETLEAGIGGSCRVAAIRSQIEETLRQFPTVENVVLSIDGRTEDILQP